MVGSGTKRKATGSPKPNQRPGFDFTRSVRALASEIIALVPELQHIDLDRVAVSFSQTRKRVMHGMQASLTPMRFEGGARIGSVRGRRMTVQQLHSADGIEMLYILNFYLPRFLNLDAPEKLATVVHELWHIGPEFDGDLRRHAGRCYAHGHSQAQYDAQVDQLVATYLARQSPSSSNHALLQMNFDELQRIHGQVFGVRISRPRLLPADE